jgi:Na+/melibiose symporter-like transporter
MCITAIIFSGILTLVSIAAIWSKDKAEFWGIAGNKKVKPRDYLSIIKSNRGIQMLIVAATTDKLASTAAGNAAVSIMVFGIIIGNYAFQGQLRLITLIPSIIMVLFGTQFARKQGSKKVTVVCAWLSILFSFLLVAMFTLFDPTQIGKDAMVTTVFFILYSIYSSLMMVSTTLVNPMIADCTDYELYRTGKYVPGMMGTLFSFVDKLISSFGATIVGFTLAAIGYRDVMPQVGDAPTSTILWTGMVLMFGMPVLGWIASIIALKFYPLDDVKMKEIQMKIAELKESAKTAPIAV